MHDVDEADTTQPGGLPHVVRTELPGNALAAGAARGFARAALDEWGTAGPAAEDAVLLISELVTNAVVHAGTAVELECRCGTDVVYAEVADRHPARKVAAGGVDGAGYGLRLLGALAKEWGISYRRDRKAVWFQLGPAPSDLPAAPETPAVPETRATPETRAIPETPAAPAAPETPAAPVAPSAPVPRAVPTDPPVPSAPAAAPVLSRAPAPADATPSAPAPGPAHPAHSAPALPPPAHSAPSSAPAPASATPAPASGAVRSAAGSRPAAGRGWTSHGALSFLAEASDLLAGHTDEDKVASLAGQLMVPRFADWCAVWLRDDDRSRLPRLARVWHAHESRIEELRARLATRSPGAAPTVPGQAAPWHWPAGAAEEEDRGASVRCDLVVGGRSVGTLVIGRAGLARIPDEILGLVEDFARRVALAVLSARRYTLQANISRILQRGLLPSEDVHVPGLDTALVYEPAGEGAWAGGDFYDLLRLPDGRWRFALGDVCGNGPEAAVVTGLARPVLRLLAKEGYSVTETLDRLNREVGEQARFLSVVYGELTFRGDLVDCTLACAGHPLPLVRDAAGAVRTAALPQLLLGIAHDVSYDSQSLTLLPGDTLLCVTDGVTERRCGRRLFDDGDGLATLFAECAGLDAGATAERLRRAVHAFAPDLPSDDLAMLVLRSPHRAERAATA
ncbi:SpoIIE family protein phosphatase [Streptomyces albus subsp. chlorinus]|uniref:SpoIIE family protein phosphatase n=1 Tax=Streptomyces albus TaxID=1888 RepID=UPI00157157B5|nr:SpoIIE family protein phosphatase [Streptomyces albus]NSC21680.1 SpoIIE family protein phosphatase [Streptomyces albus subsp. chlorinus]